MGTIPAIIYAGLMIYAYGYQVWSIHKRKSVKNLHLSYFLIVWLAVTIRVFEVGKLSMQNGGMDAIALTISEIAVFLGLLTIVVQIIWHRRKGRDW